MGRELKIGIAVVGTLAIVFCGVLYQRVTKLKKTPAAVAKADSKASEKKSLFGSSEKLTTVTAKDADRPAETVSSNDGYRWSSTSSDEKTPTTSAQEATAAQPRASFLPSDEAPPATADRYASRFADTVTQSEEPATEAVTEPVEEPSRPAEMEIESAESKPSAVNNPFARTEPVEAAAVPTEPTAPEPEAAVSEDAPIGHVAGDERPTETAVDDSIDDSSPPARLDETAVHAVAATNAQPAASANIYDRPASRFITPPEDEPAATPTAGRYSAAPAARPSAVASPSVRPGASRGIPTGKYTVGPNENFWTISEGAYGSGGYFKALHAYNAERYPVADELTVGDEVMVPPQSDLERQFPQLCPKAGRRPVNDSYAIQASARIKASGNTYVVQEGDTLFDIARYELGKASRWAELYEMNRDVIGDDIDFLRAGMELVLPDDEVKADSITRQPGDSLQR